MVYFDIRSDTFFKKYYVWVGSEYHVLPNNFGKRIRGSKVLARVK